MAIQGGFSFTGNTDRAIRSLNNMVNRQLPWAMVTTLNDTGKVLVKMNRIHMKQKLTKANNFTLNAYYHTRANKARPEVRVLRKDVQRGRHYLETLDKSRNSPIRPQKGVERRFDKGDGNLPYSGILRAIVPTTRTAGKHNRINMGQINKIKAGFKGDGKVGTRYFTAPPHSLRKFGGGSSTGGIYRVQGKRGKPQKLYHILDYLPRYPVRTDFYGVMNRHAKSYFEGTFRRNLNRALRTAKIY